MMVKSVRFEINLGRTMDPAFYCLRACWHICRRSYFWHHYHRSAATASNKCCDSCSTGLIGFLRTNALEVAPCYHVRTHRF
jgi:hypothetical protein